VARPGLTRRDVVRACTALQLLSCVPGALARTFPLAQPAPPVCPRCGGLVPPAAPAGPPA